ncbi:MAG: DUF4469 domain-containing protein [Opitutales bacterium]|nr:DUF4469 domain-containing protein [Opitutales bacterium]
MIRYYLNENLLTPDEDDYMAQVSDVRSHDMDAILERMLERGTSLSKADAKLVLEVFESTITDILEDGGAVNTPLFNVSPSVSGVFEGAEDRFDPTRHRVNLNLNPGKLLRDAEGQIETEKVTVADPIPFITQVIDAISGTTNDQLTPGGVMTLVGSRLKLITDDEDNGIFLISEADDTETKCTVIVDNKPARLIAMIPEGLTAGAYELEVRTTWTGKKPTSTMKIGRFGKSLNA